MKALVVIMILSALAAESTWATDPQVVVIANAGAPVMTKEQVADLFLGKIAGMQLLDQPNSAPVKAAFYQKVSGRDLTQVKATWARLVFTGRGRPPKELRDAAAVKKTVASDSRAIGYIYKSDVDSSVNVVLTLQ